MKKLVCLLLALLLAMSVVSVAALAQETQPKIVVDGVKDAAYSDTKMLDSSVWQFYPNNGQGFWEPFDYERVINTVWFNWDDESVYIYFQCESKDALYKPAAEETEAPNFDEVFYEIAQIYLDTAPSMDWNAPCIWAGQDGNGDTCAHIACNARGGDGSAYRLMARANPAWDQWNDYFENAAGMFMDFETFSENYAGREGYDDMAAKYDAAHGNGKGQAATFIDYDTNTYGFEMKFPRAEGEDHFQLNIRTRVNETEWEEWGPEPAYSLSFCGAWWLNSDEMIDIFYSDYEDDVPPEVAAVRRLKEALPVDVKLLGTEHAEAVAELFAAYAALSEEHAAMLTEEEVAYIEGALVQISVLTYVAALGDVNEDGNKNANDALIALRAAVGKVELDEATTLRADVNADEVVNAKDALEILQFAVQKRTQFTAAEALNEVL